MCFWLHFLHSSFLLKRRLSENDPHVTRCYYKIELVKTNAWFFPLNQFNVLFCTNRISAAGYFLNMFFFFKCTYPPGRDQNRMSFTSIWSHTEIPKYSLPVQWKLGISTIYLPLNASADSMYGSKVKIQDDWDFDIITKLFLLSTWLLSCKYQQINPLGEKIRYDKLDEKVYKPLN